MLLNVIVSTRVFIMSRLPTVCLSDTEVSFEGGTGVMVMPEAMGCFPDALEGWGGFVTMMKECQRKGGMVSNQALKMSSNEDWRQKG